MSATVSPETEEKITKLALRLVENGIKITELLAKFISAIYDKNEKIGEITVEYDFLGKINSLIASGDIIEIDYVTPDADYKIRSFLMPKGSKILPGNWTVEPAAPVDNNPKPD